MVNSIEDESTQIMMLEILQLLSEYEYVIKILSEIKFRNQIHYTLLSDKDLGLQKYLKATPFNYEVKLMQRGLGEAILVLGEK